MIRWGATPGMITDDAPSPRRCGRPALLRVGGPTDVETLDTTARLVPERKTDSMGAHFLLDSSPSSCTPRITPTLLRNPEKSPMPLKPRPGEHYTIRRKVLTLFGAKFHIYGPGGEVVGYCRQKAFKLREDIRLFTDESQSTGLLVMKAREIIDFGATYDVMLPDGRKIGSLRRKGIASLLRDSWLIFDPDGEEIGGIKEESGGLAILRRLSDELVSLISPQTLHADCNGGGRIATLRTHRNPLVHRISVAIHKNHPDVDETITIAGGLLIAAIEGRQG